VAALHAKAISDLQEFERILLDSEIAKTASLPQTRPEPSEVPSMELHFARIGEGMEKINPRQTEPFLRLTNSLRGRSGAYDEQADDPIADRRGLRCRWHLHFHAEIDRDRQSSLSHNHRHPRYYQGGQADAFGAISGALIRALVHVGFNRSIAGATVFYLPPRAGFR
jgi:hypothetical protein